MVKLFAFLLLLFLFPLVTAATIDQSDYTFAQGERIDLKRTCIINGTYCATTAVCNSTIQGPNGLNIVNNSARTVNSGWTNITLPSIPRTERYFGFYLVTDTCTQSSLSGAESYFFELTADGNPSRPFPTQLIIILIGFSLLIISIYRTEQEMLKVFSAIILFVMGVITLYPGYSYINWSTLTGLMLGSICLGVGAYFMLEPFFSRNEQEETYTRETITYEDDD